MAEVFTERLADINKQLSFLLSKITAAGNAVAQLNVIQDKGIRISDNFSRLKVDIYKHNARNPTGKKVDIGLFDPIENLIFDLQIAIEDGFAQTCGSPVKTSASQAPTGNTAPHIPLERLSLIDFNGDVSQWTSFYSLFESVVDNNQTLTPTQKMLYLIKHLSKEPLAIVKSFEITDANYYEAIRALKDRYSNERRIGSFYINKLMNFQKGQSLTEFLNVHKTSISALQQMKGIKSLSDFILFTVAYSNLESSVQKAFDLSRTCAASDIPTTLELFTFIQFYSVNLELQADKRDVPLAAKPKPNTAKKLVAHMSQNTRKTNCPECSNEHRLFACDQFKALSIADRREKVKNWGFCYNCISGRHAASDCLSKQKCKQCNSIHHSLLCNKPVSSGASPEATTPEKLVGCTQSNNLVLLGTVSCVVKDAKSDFVETFVGNRVTKILDLTPGFQFHHVASELNPADVASRGLLPHELQHHPLWWAGPPFLLQPISSWPGMSNPSPDSELPEMKRDSALHVSAEACPGDTLNETLIQRHSSLSKLQRVMAYVLRFFTNVRRKRDKLELQVGPLTAKDLAEALDRCVYISQQVEFTRELRALGKGKPTSNLRKLSPFLSAGLMRAGGRLRHSDLDYAAKHPVILSKQGHLTKLIIEYYHKVLLHAGARTTLSVIRRKFWILSGHGRVRHVIHRCLVCLRWQGKPQPPIMGDLPFSRVQVSRCFAYTCFDYMGPFITTETTRRKSPKHKSYLCLFKCEATKAVHLEVVSDLTTQGFKAAFGRFCARRSVPCQLRSDNATNFVGAKRDMLEIQKFLNDNKDSILSDLAARNVTWKMNPPRASHMGGLFEAAVKQAKLLLRRQLGNEVMTYESLGSLACAIEAVLNSRPVAFMSSDVNDGVDYLTPGHLLVGGPLVAPGECPPDLDISVLDRWKRVRQLSLNFWRSWQRNYLNTLMQREKWTKATPNLKVGDLVFMTDEQTVPLAWPIARVIKTCPGKDGIIRVVDLKTASGEYRRSVHKLIVIPPSTC